MSFLIVHGKMIANVRIREYTDFFIHGRPSRLFRNAAYAKVNGSRLSSAGLVRAPIPQSPPSSSQCFRLPDSAASMVSTKIVVSRNALPGKSQIHETDQRKK